MDTKGLEGTRMSGAETVKLVARSFGTAGRPPLVLLHGLLGSARNWQTVGRDLAADSDVYALDLRNHGQSPHADAMSYDAMVADVAAWLDATLAGAPVTLVGHSMGGKVAMALACRQSQRVARLVVVDIAPKSYLSMGHRAEFAAMHELRLEDLRSRAEAELRMEARVSDWAVRKFLTTNLERAPEGEGGAGASGGWRWVVNLPALTAALPELEANPLGAEERYAGPVKFILGGRSRYVTEADHAAIRAHFPAAAIVTLPEAGHNPHMDAREAFVAALRAAP